MQWRQPISLSHLKLHLQGFPCNSLKTADCNICAASMASLSRASMVSLRERSPFVMQIGLCGMAWIQITIMLNGNFKAFPNETMRLGVAGIAKHGL